MGPLGNLKGSISLDLFQLLGQIIQNHIYIYAKAYIFNIKLQIAIWTLSTKKKRFANKIERLEVVSIQAIMNFHRRINLDILLVICSYFDLILFKINSRLPIYMYLYKNYSSSKIFHQSKQTNFRDNGVHKEMKNCSILMKNQYCLFDFRIYYSLIYLSLLYLKNLCTCLKVMLIN